MIDSVYYCSIWFVRVVTLAGALWQGLVDAHAQEKPALGQLQSALQFSARTGHPVLVIVGREDCLPCRKLKQELKTDPELSEILQACLYIQLDCDSSDYRFWVQKHPPQDATLPQLFFVRADGIELFNRSGNLPNGDLKRLMIDSIERSGQRLEEPQAQQLEKLVAQIKRQRETEGAVAAALSVTQAASWLRLAINSPAQPAVKLRQELQSLNHELKAEIEFVRQKLSQLSELSPVDQIDQVRQIANTIARLRPIRPVAAAAAELQREAMENAIYSRNQGFR